MRPNKRAKLCISHTFLDIEAQVSGQDDSEECQSDEDLQSFLVEADVDLSEGEAAMTPAIEITQFAEEEELNALANRARQKFRRQKSQPRWYEDSSLRELARRASHNPYSGHVVLGSDVLVTTSMKLFLVPMKIGMELDVGIELESRVMAPCRVLASPRLLGRIYILSPNKNVARNYLRGTTSMDFNPYLIQRVPSNDMGIIFNQMRTQRNDKLVYAPKRWVRFRRGPLKTKFGYVLSVRSDDLLRVAVIHSVGLNGETGSTSSIERSVDRLGYGERDLWLVHDIAVRSSPQELEDSDSLQILSVYGIHVADPTEPHASEVADFTTLGFDTLRTTNRSLLQPGDQIKLVAGDLRGSMGVVKQILGDEAKVELDQASRDPCRSSILIALSDMERIFEIGMAVMAKIGKHAERDGYIVASKTHDLVVLERSARNEFVVPKAFVQTRSPQADLTYYGTHKRGAIEGSLVYVIELKVVGRILHAADDGSIELDLPTPKGRKNMIFRSSEIVDIDNYQRLDGVQFDGVGEVTIALSKYIDRRALHGTENVKIRPHNSSSLLEPRQLRNAKPDTDNLSLPPSSSLSPIISRDIAAERAINQDVYVLKNIKKFGKLIAVNGNSHAIVLLDGDLQPQAFPRKEVVSLYSFLCLDNSVASDIDDILHMSLRRSGRMFRLPWNLRLPDMAQSETKSPACSWVLDSQIQDLLQKHRIFFRFVDSCVSPGNVSRMPAWTNVGTTIRSCGSDTRKGENNAYKIYVSYKTRDAKEYSSFVLLSQLMNFNPKTVDKALVVKGPDVGQILPVERMDKSDKDRPRAILLRESGSGRNKKLLRYELSDVTKIQSS